MKQINPFNLEKRIALLDKIGNLLHHVNQREAGHFLRSSQAKLLMQYPTTIQLLIEENEIIRPPKMSLCGGTSKSGNQNWLHFSKSVIYGNYRVQNPDGREMFHCDAIKVLWYLNRDLVDIVSTDPAVVRLKFRPNGDGHHDDEYYLTPKVNRCVVCGRDNKLNRHHVVPYCFRRYMPEVVKDHSYHDVLLLCLNCHEKYERHADELKVQLAQQHEIKMHPTVHYDEDMGKAIKSAFALIRHGDRMPQERQDFLFTQVANYLNKTEVTEEDLLSVSGLDAYEKEEEYEYGRIVLTFWDLQEFVEMWRKHFIECMQPQYMPEFWDMKRDCVRRRLSNNEKCGETHPLRT